jgi:phospholipase D-like protein
VAYSHYFLTLLLLLLVTMSESDHRFSPWISDFKDEAIDNQHDQPNYYVNDPDTLGTSAKVHSFMVGTGRSIYEQLESVFDSVEEELILITCFWASSESQKIINRALRRLSDKSSNYNRPKIRVFLGLSSLSWYQKIFQTSSLSGYVYPSSKWKNQLYLPSPDEIPGIDLIVKSIFVRPFSVMHPKFIVIDRKIVCLPSCNVSWEDWFEGALIMSGPVVQNFIQFWQNFWSPSSPILEARTEANLPNPGIHPGNILISPFPLRENLVDACFLPSPHHANPEFRPLWFQAPASPRSTPLNHFLKSHIDSAETSVYIQTPNITCKPLIKCLLEALGRGVDVHIITSERLMILEQLVTAGTLTNWCIDALIKNYHSLLRSRNMQDEESALREPGQLRVEYFISREGAVQGEPVQSHIKVSIFDNQVVVLGSGNMDRASWFTSQELGVGFCCKELVKIVRNTLQEGLKGRRKVRYDSMVVD